MTETPEFKNRIVEVIKVKGSELRDHPMNPRKHPERQKKVVRGLLSELGKADVLKAYRSEKYKGLVCLDGHLRKDIDPNEEWTVAVLDFSDEEAEKFIATFDAATSLAELDEEVMKVLHEGIVFVDPSINAMLTELREMADPNIFADETEPIDDIMTEKKENGTISLKFSRRDFAIVSKGLNRFGKNKVASILVNALKERGVDA